MTLSYAYYMPLILFLFLDWRVLDGCSLLNSPCLWFVFDVFVHFCCSNMMTMPNLTTTGTSYNCDQLDFACPSAIEDVIVPLFRECLECNRSRVVLFARIALESLNDGSGPNLDVYAMIGETLKGLHAVRYILEQTTRHEITDRQRGLNKRRQVHQSTMDEVCRLDAQQRQHVECLDVGGEVFHVSPEVCVCVCVCVRLPCLTRHALYTHTRHRSPLQTMTNHGSHHFLSVMAHNEYQSERDKNGYTLVHLTLGKWSFS